MTIVAVASLFLLGISQSAVTSESAGIDALGAIVGTWQSDVVDGRSARSWCAWTPQRLAVLCEQTIKAPDGEHRVLNLFTYDSSSHKYFLYVEQQAGITLAPVPIAIEGRRWVYGGAAAPAGQRRFRTINDFSERDVYTWTTESSEDGVQWTRVTGGHSTRVRQD